jgi:hypothetical protein
VIFTGYWETSVNIKLLCLTALLEGDKRVCDLVGSSYRHLIGIARELACRRRGTIHRKAHCEHAVAASIRPTSIDEICDGTVLLEY